MATIYCGNNSRDLGLRTGAKVIGTRYNCFRRGVGVGLGLPYDATYATRYVPIDKRKIYCGTEHALPAGYHIMGSNGMCYTKGVGVGRSIKAKKVRKGKSKMRFRKSRKRRSPKSRKRSRKRKSRKRSRKRKSRKRSRKRKSRKRSRKRKSRSRKSRSIKCK